MLRTVRSRPIFSKLEKRITGRQLYTTSSANKGDINTGRVYDPAHDPMLKLSPEELAQLKKKIESDTSKLASIGYLALGGGGVILGAMYWMLSSRPAPAPVPSN